jgi:hypothetical protein
MRVDLLDPDLLAQETHVLAAVLAVLGAIVFGFPWWTGASAILVVAAVKETFIDPHTETDQPAWPEGAIDFAFYVVGVAVVFAVLLLTHRVL